MKVDEIGVSVHRRSVVEIVTTEASERHREQNEGLYRFCQYSVNLCVLCGALFSNHLNSIHAAI